jgi:hypothetical protein
MVVVPILSVSLRGLGASVCSLGIIAV